MARGERESVIEFLDLVARFWANPDKEPQYRKADAEKKRAMIDAWKQQVHAGETPNDPRWR